jgi:hypothetical protein
MSIGLLTLVSLLSTQTRSIDTVSDTGLSNAAIKIHDQRIPKVMRSRRFITSAMLEYKEFL